MNGNTVVGRMVATDDHERQRWETLYRTLANLVTQWRRACPQDRYDIEVRLVTREQQQQPTRG